MGGAIIGAIIGGAKGAAIGDATGAAGGGAVVMAGDRNAATLPAGTDRDGSTVVPGRDRCRARAVTRAFPFHHPGECHYRTNGRPSSVAARRDTPFRSDNYFDSNVLHDSPTVEFPGAYRLRPSEATRWLAYRRVGVYKRGPCLRVRVPQGE